MAMLLKTGTEFLWPAVNEVVGAEGTCKWLQKN